MQLFHGVSKKMKKIIFIILYTDQFFICIFLMLLNKICVNNYEFFSLGRQMLNLKC